VKVLHVLETLSPHYGGPVSMLQTLAEAQQRTGHEVTIVTTNADHPRGMFREPGWDTLAQGAVPVYYAPVQFAPLRFSRQLAAYLKRTIAEFDIVHVHGLYRFPPSYAAYQARRQGVPYVIRPHGSLDPYLYGRSTRGLWLKRLYERWFDLPNLHAAGAIHYTAEEERERASFINLRAASFVLPNGLDWSRYSDLPARGALRRRWGLGDAPLVLFVGRLHFKKGLDLLIPAFDTLCRRVPGVQLVIAGPENDDYGRKVRGWVRARALETIVHFVGPLHGTDVVQAYVDADLFALPSYTENFGMTVVEAMASALPVVISDQVNIHAEVSGAGAGVVTRCDADEVAQALEALLRDAERRRAVGEAGRRLVQARYTWPAVVEALTREYEAVIARHKGGKGLARAKSTVAT
jgi:glycosyltransferase involved in cell wall biosynthesis